MYIDGWHSGTDPVATGNDSTTASPHGVFPAAGDDRWVAIVASDDAQWAALCQLAGWTPEPGWELLAGRLAGAQEIARRLAAWTADQDAAALAGRLQARGISACPVMGPLEHLDDQHLASRRFIVELDHPEVGPERHAGNPLRLSLTEQRTAASAPCLGAHTTEVLGQVLGLAPDEVERMVAEGVCV